MIQNITRAGNGKVTVTVGCDMCKFQTVEFRVLGGASEPGKKNATIMTQRDPLMKLLSSGWETIGKNHYCPACREEMRKPAIEKEPKMLSTPAVQAPREATKEQKREINAMLDLVYDTKAERYKGENTDKSVAADIGHHILWGWVKKQREDLYGMREGNEVAERLLAEAKEWMNKADQLGGEMHDTHAVLIAKLREFNDAKSKVADLIKRLADAVEPGSVGAK